MNRRGFLTTCASLIPLPAFVKAASLWLPPERPKVMTVEEMQLEMLLRACQRAVEASVNQGLDAWLNELSAISYQSALMEGG